MRTCFWKKFESEIHFNFQLNLKTVLLIFQRIYKITIWIIGIIITIAYTKVYFLNSCNLYIKENFYIYEKWKISFSSKVHSLETPIHNPLLTEKIKFIWPSTTRSIVHKKISPVKKNFYIAHDSLYKFNFFLIILVVPLAFLSSTGSSGWLLGCGLYIFK